MSQNVITGVSNIPNHIDNIRDIYDKGSLTTEQYQNAKFDRQFFNSDAYKTITQDSSIDQTNIRERTQQFLDNGITDVKVIKEALQEGISGDDYKAYSDAGITSAKDIKAFTQNNITADKLEKIKLYSGETDVKKMQRYNAIANAAKIAGIPHSENAFVTWARTMNRMDDEDAKKLFKQVNYYW